MKTPSQDLETGNNDDKKQKKQVGQGITDSLKKRSIFGITILFTGDHTTSQTRGTRDKPSRELFQQNGLILGGPRPIPWSKTAFEQSDLLKGGCYTLSNDCLELSKYGDLLLKKYSELVYVRPITTEELNLFSALGMSAEKAA